MRKTTALGAAVGVLVSVLAVGPAAAQYGMDKKAPKNAATPELPKCDKPLGRVAIREPENDWWTGLGLSNPEAVIKLFAMRSGCLRVVDRNAGLAMRAQEAELGSGGDLRRGSNVGKGQVAAADFFIVPDLANSNGNSSGGAIGAAVGAFGGRLGMAGALASGLTVKSQQAQALITLVDARTTEQLYVAEGVSKKTDIGFGGGGYYDGFGAIGGGYGNTAMGKVVTAAYFNAFVDLVGYLQRSAPTGEEASQAAGAQAQKVKQATVMRAAPAPKSAEVRSFAIGDTVYPTGQKNGIWWEVDDENGNRGWVSSAMIGPA